MYDGKTTSAQYLRQISIGDSIRYVSFLSLRYPSISTVHENRHIFFCEIVADIAKEQILKPRSFLSSILLFG